jgi:predicted GH43/DUF377 family glycosyl hydrolase
MTSKNKNIFFVSDDEKVFFLYGGKKNGKLKLKLSESKNGFKFSLLKKTIIFKKTVKINENLAKGQSFHIVKTGNQYFLNYEKQVGKDKNIKVYGAISTDLNEWKVTGILKNFNNAGAVVPDFFYDNDQVMYFGAEKNIKIAYSKDLLKWKQVENNVLKIAYLTTKVFSIDYILSQRMSSGSTDVTLSSSSSAASSSAKGKSSSADSGIKIQTNDEVKFWEELDLEFQSILNRPHDRYKQKNPSSIKIFSTVSLFGVSLF